MWPLTGKLLLDNHSPLLKGKKEFGSYHSLCEHSLSVICIFKKTYSSSTLNPFVFCSVNVFPFAIIQSTLCQFPEYLTPHH